MDRAELPRGQSAHANALSSRHPRVCLPPPSIHPLCFFTGDVSATVLSRVIFILLLPQSLRRKNIIAKLLYKVILSFAINNLINYIYITIYKHNYKKNYMLQYAS